MSLKANAQKILILCQCLYFYKTILDIEIEIVQQLSVNLSVSRKAFRRMIFDNDEVADYNREMKQWNLNCTYTYQCIIIAINTTNQCTLYTTRSTWISSDLCIDMKLSSPPEFICWRIYFIYELWKYSL